MAGRTLSSTVRPIEGALEVRQLSGNILPVGAPQSPPRGQPHRAPWSTEQEGPSPAAAEGQILRNCLDPPQTPPPEMEEAGVRALPAPFPYLPMAPEPPSFLPA